jgi:hypothetical protein
VSSLKKHIQNQGTYIRNPPLAEAIYLFRCGETGLYALTADPSGEILPSKLYPQIKWRLERHVTLQPAAHSPDGKISRATRGAIAKHGFYLTHAAAHSARIQNSRPLSGELTGTNAISINKKINPGINGVELRSNP